MDTLRHTYVSSTRKEPRGTPDELVRALGQLTSEMAGFRARMEKLSAVNDDVVTFTSRFGALVDGLECRNDCLQFPVRLPPLARPGAPC